MSKKASDIPQKAGTEKASSDPVYTVEEFAAVSHKVFNTTPDLVTAAFRSAGVERATRKEAEKLVSAFQKRPVG